MPVPVGVPDADLTLSFYEPIGGGPVHAYFSGSPRDVLDAGRGPWLGVELVVVVRRASAEGAR